MVRPRREEQAGEGVEIDVILHMFNTVRNASEERSPKKSWELIFYSKQPFVDDVQTDLCILLIMNWRVARLHQGGVKLRGRVEVGTELLLAGRHHGRECFRCAALLTEAQAEQKELSILWGLKLIEPVDVMNPAARRSRGFNLNRNLCPLEVMSGAIGTPPSSDSFGRIDPRGEPEGQEPQLGEETHQLLASKQRDGRLPPEPAPFRQNLCDDLRSVGSFAEKGRSDLAPNEVEDLVSRGVFTAKVDVAPLSLPPNDQLLSDYLDASALDIPQRLFALSERDQQMPTTLGVKRAQQRRLP